MVEAGILPSSQRVKEYLQSFSSQIDLRQGKNMVLGCIADVLRMEEERCLPAEPAWIELLTILDSDKSNQDFKIALSGVESR